MNTKRFGNDKTFGLLAIIGFMLMALLTPAQAGSWVLNTSSNATVTDSDVYATQENSPYYGNFRKYHNDNHGTTGSSGGASYSWNVTTHAYGYNYNASPNYYDYVVPQTHCYATVHPTFDWVPAFTGDGPMDTYLGLDLVYHAKYHNVCHLVASASADDTATGSSDAVPYAQIRCNGPYYEDLLAFHQDTDGGLAPGSTVTYSDDLPDGDVVVSQDSTGWHMECLAITAEANADYHAELSSWHCQAVTSTAHASVSIAITGVCTAN